GARPSARIRSWIHATADPPASCCASRHLLRIAPPQCASPASLRRATPLASPVRLVYAPIIGHHTSDLWGGVAVVPRSADLDLPVPRGRAARPDQPTEGMHPR